MLRDRYEELKNLAMSSSFIRAPRGMALLLSRGMPEWMHVWSHILPQVVTISTAEAPNAEYSGMIRDAPRSQMVKVLARMAIESSRGRLAC